MFVRGVINCARAIISAPFNTLSQARMSKQKKGKGPKQETQASGENSGAVTLDKANNILIQILAKPGAKQNAITDVTSEGVGVQINAPPADGEANAELVRYLASVVGVRKGDVSLERGFKSRQKTVKVLADSATLEMVKEKIDKEMKS